jgi:hypothetical protein
MPPGWRTGTAGTGQAWRRGARRRRVVVQAQEVDGLLQRLDLGGRPVRPGLAEHLAQLLRVGAQQRRVQVLPVHVGVGQAGRMAVGVGRVRPDMLGLDVHHQADLVPAGRAVGLHALRMGLHQPVRHDGRFIGALVAGRQRAMHIALVGDDPGLVQRHPQLHAVVQRAEATWA